VKRHTSGKREKGRQQWAWDGKKTTRGEGKRGDVKRAEEGRQTALFSASSWFGFGTGGFLRVEKGGAGAEVMVVAADVSGSSEGDSTMLVAEGSVSLLIVIEGRLLPPPPCSLEGWDPSPPSAYGRFSFILASSLPLLSPPPRLPNTFLSSSSFSLSSLLFFSPLPAEVLSSLRLFFSLADPPPPASSLNQSFPDAGGWRGRGSSGRGGRLDVAEAAAVEEEVLVSVKEVENGMGGGLGVYLPMWRVRVWVDDVEGEGREEESWETRP
jgi:hypothetical protein